MSGDYEATFARCKTAAALQVVIDVVLAQESWPASPRRIDVAEAAFSKSWVMLTPCEWGFFIARGGTNATRLARLAKALRAPVFQITVRNSVATTLFEADALGRLRISGSSTYFVDGSDDARDPTGQHVISDEVGFGLLSVTDAIRERIAALVDDYRLPDYLGELAGFPRWQFEPPSSELVCYDVKSRRGSR